MSGITYAVYQEQRRQVEELKDAITRKRVEALEGLLGRGLWGRLKWLFFRR